MDVGRRMLRVDLICISLLGFLQLCSSQDITCTVTRHGGLTTYRIPEFTATNCHYRWTNSTNHVLANHEQEIPGLVVINSNSSLVTNTCTEVIHYMRDCISEGTPRNANCTADCSENEPQSGGGVSRNHWIVLLPVSIMFLLLVGLLLRYKRRNHI